MFYETRGPDDPNHGDGSERLSLPWATLTLIVVFVGAIGYAAWLLLGGK